MEQENSSAVPSSPRAEGAQRRKDELKLGRKISAVLFFCIMCAAVVALFLDLSGVMVGLGLTAAWLFAMNFLINSWAD